MSDVVKQADSVRDTVRELRERLLASLKIPEFVQLLVRSRAARQTFGLNPPDEPSEGNALQYAMGEAERYGILAVIFSISGDVERAAVFAKYAGRWANRARLER